MGQRRHFSLEQDLPRLVEVIEQNPGTRLVIIDPISAYTGKVDSHNNSEVRGLLKTVRRLPDGSKQEFDANGRFVRVLASNEAPGKAKSDIVRYIPGDPNHVDVVKRIFRLYIEGYGYHSIMRQLNDDGIPGPTGRVWRMTSVRDILTHPVYTGAIVWNRSTGGKIHAVGENGKAESRPNAKRIHRKPKKQWVVIDDVHEPLVSKADFDKVQEIVSKRRKAGGAAKPNRRYLLSGLMRCERCGFTFLGRPLGNKQKRYRYYVDGGHHRGGNAICPHRQIPADALEHWVIGQVKSVILGESETVEAATKAVLKSLKQRTKAEKPSKSLTQELAAINKRIQGLAAMLADPNLGDLDEIHQTLVDLKKRRDALEEQRCQSARTSRQEISEPAIREWIAEKLATLEESLANPDATIPARNLMAAFVDRIEIAKEGKRGTLYLITNPAHVFETETSTRVLVGDRIDMIYFHSASYQPVEAFVVGEESAETELVWPGRWPSDHRAVLVKFDRTAAAVPKEISTHSAAVPKSSDQ